MREFCALCKVNYEVKEGHSSECPYCQLQALREAAQAVVDAEWPNITPAIDALRAALKQGEE